ncbi:MAG: hypothetical protein IAF58_11580 [Leptolyngbya sp.]|nr:hypothetical protein [Candidatus Melainabacteria bacterium]
MNESVANSQPEDSLKLMKLAQSEARRSGHSYVGTEQLLLALIALKESLSGEALEGVGCELEATREAVERVTGKGAGAPGAASNEIPFTPAANKVLENAYTAACDLGHEKIQPEHILLGLLALTNGVAIQVLEDMDVNQTELRDVLLEMIKSRN